MDQTIPHTSIIISWHQQNTQILIEEVDAKLSNLITFLLLSRVCSPFLLFPVTYQHTEPSGILTAKRVSTNSMTTRTTWCRREHTTKVDIHVSISSFQGTCLLLFTTLSNIVIHIITLQTSDRFSCQTHWVSDIFWESTFK